MRVPNNNAYNNNNIFYWPTSPGLPWTSEQFPSNWVSSTSIVSPMTPFFTTMVTLDGNEYSVDFPGVIPETLKVEIVNNNLFAIGTRTNGLSVKAEVFLSSDCDVNASEATLHLGILTVKIPKIKESRTHKVNVSIK